MVIFKNGDTPKRYTYVRLRARRAWFRSQIAQHRKNKRSWEGTKEGYQTELDHMLNRVQYYKDKLLEPAYVLEGARVRNRKRRKKRKPLRRILTTVPVERPAGTIRSLRLFLAAGGTTREDEYLAHLPWMIERIKKKKYKTLRHLAYHYRKPIKWIREALDIAVKQDRITEHDLENTYFRRPGRPKKGTPRGPYKKKLKTGQNDNVRT